MATPLRSPLARALRVALLVVPLVISCTGTDRVAPIDPSPPADAWSIQRHEATGSTFYSVSIDPGWRWPEVDLPGPGWELVFVLHVREPVSEALALRDIVLTTKTRSDYYFVRDRPTEAALEEMFLELERALERSTEDGENDRLSELFRRWSEAAARVNRLEFYDLYEVHPEEPESPLARFALQPYLLDPAGGLDPGPFVMKEEPWREAETPTFVWADEKLPADHPICPDMTPEECFWERLRADVQRMCRGTTTQHLTPGYLEACRKLEDLLAEGKINLQCTIEGANGTAHSGSINMDGNYYLSDMCSFSTLIHEAAHIVFDGANPPADPEYSDLFDEIMRRRKEITERFKAIDAELASPTPATDPDALSDEQRRLAAEIMDQERRLRESLEAVRARKIENECNSYAIVRDNLARFRELMPLGDSDSSGFPDWAEWGKDEVASITGTFEEWWERVGEGGLPADAKEKLCACLKSVKEWLNEPENRPLKEACMEYGVYDDFIELQEDVCRD